MRVLSVGGLDELEKAFTAAAQERLGGLVIHNDALFISDPDQLAALGIRFQLPTIYESRQHAEAGGLVSYGTNTGEMYYLLGTQTSRILMGERPSDLPVQFPTKFELIINVKPAKALGLSVPPTLLARADEVIE